MYYVRQVSAPTAILSRRPNPEWKAELSQKTTPRGEDGKPDLVGMWQRSGGSFEAEHGPYVEFTRLRDPDGGGVDVWRGRGDGAVSFINFERDSGIALRAAKNKPQYKPEHWERVQWMDKHGNQEDPEFVCYPSGGRGWDLPTGSSGRSPTSSSSCIRTGTGSWSG